MRPLSRTSSPWAKDLQADKFIQRLSEGEKIFDRFFWDEVLQEQGDGGKVVVCRRKMSGQDDRGEQGSRPEFVLKMRSKASFDNDEDSEATCRKIYQRLLKLPPHPGIIRVYEVFEDDRFFYTVMPRANGGTLIDGLLRHFRDGIIPTSELKALMRDILEGVGFVHANGMLHRDLKPDNLVLQVSQCGNTQTRRVVLIDFDRADPNWHATDGFKLSDTFVGTPRFSAPETFHGQFSQQSDLYSVGAVLYLLVTGKLPYEDTTFAEFSDSLAKPEPNMRGGLHAAAAIIQSRMESAPIDFDCKPWKSQPACRELCRALLDFDPLARPNCAEQVLSFSWFSDAAKL